MQNKSSDPFRRARKTFFHLAAGPHPTLTCGIEQTSYEFGTASKAMVVRDICEWNGTVPCHIYDGNSTSVPGAGFTVRRTGSLNCGAKAGSPNLSQPCFSPVSSAASGMAI